MPSDTPDQGLTLPIGADVADNPVAFTNFVADVEQRLVRLYASEADRTARRASVAENEISALADVDRVDIYTGALDISLYTRALFAFKRMAANQTLTASSTALQNVTDLVVAMPAAGTFSFRCSLYYDTSAVADIKFAFNIPAGVTMRWGGIGPSTGGGAAGDAAFSTASASDSAVGYGGGGVGTILGLQIEGEYVAGGTAGNLQLRAAQNTSEASVTLVIARSRLEVWRTA